MSWVTFFSHTGSEIVNVANELGRWPDKIITNNPPGSDHVHESLDVIYVPDRPTLSDYMKHISPGDVVTLHGWMRIIPPELCDKVEMYNLHPGLITEFPELKGANPQKHVAVCLDDRYKKIGCVIHKVIPEVDEGEVLMESSTFNDLYSEEMITHKLHEMAQDMWVMFLRDRLR